MDSTLCPVRAIGRCFFHISVHAKKADTFLSSYWVDDENYDVTDVDIRATLKFAVGELNYPELKGIPIAITDTHSIWGGRKCPFPLGVFRQRNLEDGSVEK